MIKNANILITGATSGIGEALALHYAQNGAANLFLAGRNKERLQKVSEACKNNDTHIYTKIIDVTDANAMQDWIKECENTAPLNLVIANAGVSTGEENETNVRNTIQTNVNGVINTILPIIDIYKTRTDNGKQIAMLSSIAGYHGLPTCPSYSASKAFVKAWGEALRLHLRENDIRVSVICPGFVRSRITDKNTCPMPFFMEADKAAGLIAQGLEKDKGIIAFPWPLRLTSWFMSCLPNVLSNLIYGRLPHKV